MSAATDRTGPIAAPRLPLQTLAVFVALVLANGIAWAWAFALFSDRPAVMGAALLAWVFGLRHAVDADHIAAIDNVVRKWMQQGEQPRMAGLFFSLGHSTVVVIAAALLALTAAAMQDRLAGFKSVGGVIGTSVSSAE